MDAGRGGVPVVGPGLGQAEASFTLALPLHGRRVLVVGGGTAATQTVTALRAAGAIARVVSPTLSPALTELAARGLIEVASRQYQMRDLTDAWLAFACSDPRAGADLVRDSRRCRPTAADWGYRRRGSAHPRARRCAVR